MSKVRDWSATVGSNEESEHNDIISGDCCVGIGVTGEKGGLPGVDRVVYTSAGVSEGGGLNSMSSSQNI